MRLIRQKLFALTEAAAERLRKIKFDKLIKSGMSEEQASRALKNFDQKILNYNKDSLLRNEAHNMTHGTNRHGWKALKNEINSTYNVNVVPNTGATELINNSTINMREADKDLVPILAHEASHGIGGKKADTFYLNRSKVRGSGYTVNRITGVPKKNSYGVKVPIEEVRADYGITKMIRDLQKKGKISNGEAKSMIRELRGGINSEDYNSIVKNTKLTKEQKKEQIRELKKTADKDPFLRDPGFTKKHLAWSYDYDPNNEISVYASK